MEVDLVLSTLLVLLGAQVSYLLDELFEFTPLIAAWLERLIG